MAIWRMQLGNENGPLFVRTANTTIAVSFSNWTVGWTGSGAEVRWEASDLCWWSPRAVPHPGSTEPGSHSCFPAGRKGVNLSVSLTPVTHITFLFSI